MEYIGSLKQDAQQGKANGADEDAENKPIPPASLLDNYPDTSINPYELMGVERNATEADIKRAYKKGALRWHPDKHPPDQKAKAQKAFQRLTTAYAVLVDPIRRRHYDATGKVQDSLHIDPNDPWRWQPFYQHCWTKMAEGDVEAFANEYRFSEEERQDLLKQYTLRKGNMTKVYEHVTLSNPLEDDERYRKWINEAIEKGEVESYNAFTKETVKSIRSRKDKARREAQEAESLKATLKEKGTWFEPPSNQDSTDLLALSIQAKNKSRSVALLDHLMDKYVKKPGKKGGKKDHDTLPDEPSEAAFEKNRKKKFQEALKRDKLREEQKASEKRRKRKAAQMQEEEVDNNDDQQEEVESRNPVRRWNERRKKVKQMLDDEDEVRQRNPSGDEDPKQAKKDSAIWGEPLKHGTYVYSDDSDKQDGPAKRRPAPVKKAKPAVKRSKAAAKTTGKGGAKTKQAVVESENEDEHIELGSQDSDEDDEDEG